MLDAVKAVGKRGSRERNETFQTVEVKDGGFVQHTDCGNVAVRPSDQLSLKVGRGTTYSFRHV